MEEDMNLELIPDELWSLPIVDSKECKSAIQWMHIRIRHQSTLGDLNQFLDRNFDKYIVSVEKKGTPDQHFHMVVQWSKKITDVGEFLRSYDKEIKGNKCFSASWMKSENLFSYVVKDSEFKYKGFLDKEIKDFKKKSYCKYDKEEFAKKLNGIVDKYLLDNKAVSHHLAYDIIKLKVEYKQIVDTGYIQKYVTMVECKKNPQLVGDISMRIHNKIYGIE